MKRATFWLILLAALPCAASNKRSAADLKGWDRAGRPAGSPTTVYDVSTRRLLVANLSVVWADLVGRRV